MTSYTKVTKAKLKLSVQTTTKLYQVEPFVLRTPQELPKDYRTRFPSESVLSPKRPTLINTSPIVNLPLSIKHEIAKQPFKQRALFTEVGHVLNEICDVVVAGKPYKKEEHPILNRLAEEKMKQKEKEQLEAQELEKKRREHAQQLHDKLKVLKAEKEEQQRTKIQEMLTKNMSPNKKVLEWKRYHEEQKELIKEYQTKKEYDKEMQEREERNKRREERERKKKEFQEFNERKISELVKSLDLDSLIGFLLR